MVRQVGRRLVVGGQRVPVGHEEEAIVVLLQVQPAFQGAVEVAQVRRAPVGRMPESARGRMVVRREGVG